MKRWPWFLVAAGVLALDQGSKAVVDLYFAPGDGMPLIPRVLSLLRVHNTGAAFGLFPEGTVAFVVVASAVTALLGGYLLSGRAHGLCGWGAALVVAGALGNLLDRVQRGYVLDFLALPHFPVFNVADSALVLGAFLLGLGLLRRTR